jgi:hypothetical protein
MLKLLQNTEIISAQYPYSGIKPSADNVEEIFARFSCCHAEAQDLVDGLHSSFDGSNAGITAETFRRYSTGLVLLADFTLLFILCLGHHAQATGRSGATVRFIELIKAAGRCAMAALDVVPCILDDLSKLK